VTANISIAIDAMGGDYGPSVTVPAALQVLATRENLQLILVGDQERIHRELQQSNGALHPRLVIHHASQQVAMDELPSHALRKKKDSSMRVAINLVKQGEVHAAVSAGNTGALMAIARFVLKTLPGIDRPAIIATFPTYDAEKKVRVLDLGANIDSCADNLYQFAVMGSIVAAAIDNIESPRVGLLNIGEEEIKGNDLVKHTAQLLTDSRAINYIGYVEGNDLFTGVADVIVCDGFIGNVTLKTMEGVAKFIGHFAKEAFKKNWYNRLSALIAKPALADWQHRVDPGRRNGASLLGLQGIVIKSHGNANVPSYANAIYEAIHEVEQNIPERIRQEVALQLEES
jgi:glycerol-3-phosphate acyltransferase PlsX